MRGESYWKARTLLKEGKVSLEKETPSFIFFKAGKELVDFNKRKNTWGCGCVHGSLYGKQEQKQFCYHIKAVKIFQKAREENQQRRVIESGTDGTIKAEISA